MAPQIARGAALAFAAAPPLHLSQKEVLRISALRSHVPALARLRAQDSAELRGRHAPNLRYERWHHLEEVCHQAIVRDLEDRRLGVLVDCHDDP